MTLRDAWTRYATWPLIARVVVAIAILGACVLVADYCGAWWQNRETDRVLAEVAEKNRQIDEQRRKIDVLTGEIQAKDEAIRQKDQELAVLKAEAEKQDERIQQTNTRYRQARRRPAADPGDAALDERLRRYRDAPSPQ